MVCDRSQELRCLFEENELFLQKHPLWGFSSFWKKIWLKTLKSLIDFLRNFFEKMKSVLVQKAIEIAVLV